MPCAKKPLGSLISHRAWLAGRRHEVHPSTLPVRRAFSRTPDARGMGLAISITNHVNSVAEGRP